MSQAIPEKYRDLFSKRAFASLGTLMPDGSPQVTPVWCDIEGDLVIVNTATARQKDKNMRRDPRVAPAIIDPENPDRYLAIRGRVVALTEQGPDGPGGTQVPQRVSDAISGYLCENNANTCGAYATSRNTDRVIGEARSAMADFLGCDSDEIVFGPNMTTLTFGMSRAIGRELGP